VSYDDAYEDNDTRATASDLGTLPGPVRTVAGLRLRDDDWFRFATTADGLAGDSVRIDFVHAQDDLDMALYDAAGTLLASSSGVTNSETIALADRPAGTYYLRVYGYAGA